MTVNDLIKKLEKLPHDAEVLTHQPDVGGFRRVELIKTEDGKLFENKFGKIVVILDEKPFVSKKEQPQEEEQLCPGCNVAYCQGRYTTGQCE